MSLDLNNPNVFSCPTRRDFEGDDTWLQKGPVARCSYCGSLQPRTVLRFLDAGWKAKKEGDSAVALESPLGSGVLLRYTQRLEHLSEADRRALLRAAS